MKKIKILLATGMVCLFSACATSPNQPNVSAPQPKPTERLTYLKEGDSFPVVSVVDINNETIALNNAGQKKLIILFATWCSDSQRFVKQLNASPLIKANNIKIIGIGRNESKESLATFAQDFSINYSLVPDENRDIYNQVANVGIPRIILIDEQNIIVKTIIGESANTIEEVVW